MAPMGRPKATTPKDVDIKVRFTKEKNEQILQYCKMHNITRAEAIRQGVDKLLDEEKK